ncbi:MAG: class I SAM-dependent methyltransferase [Dehalococcoidia bacterium]
MDPSRNPWDEQAERYGVIIAERERTDVTRGPLISRMLDLLGDVAGREVLDACCGEGFFARILAARGARVIGLDLSPRLIQMAQAKNPHHTIDYRVADLSRPLPDLDGRFSLIASHMALNDVREYQGFAATLASLAAPETRAVLAFNNPYSLVVRGHIADYFDSGAIGVYGGLREMGVEAPYVHRTLEEYLDAFLTAGFRLAKLVDVPHAPGVVRFPSLMILAFDRP